MNKTDFEKILDSSITESFSIINLSPIRAEGALGVSFEEGINSCILLKGDIIGKISIFLLKRDAENFVSLMLGVDDSLSLSENEILDGIGELTNIIAGVLKTKASSRSCHFDISIPSNSVSHTARESQMHNVEMINQLYQSGEHLFQVSLSYRLAKKETPKEEPLKPKISAADLLSQLINKNMQEQKNGKTGTG